MLISTAILAPVVALLLLTSIVWAWMYVTRIPAMQAANIDMDKANQQTPAELAGSLPANVRWKADNYNHLMEQLNTQLKSPSKFTKIR